ncbi:MAG: SOS response-associated peptidase [Chloroflexota bacterium]|nr:SOS response-associated peptidase [Chloroflexota bacterium]
MCARFTLTREEEELVETWRQRGIEVTFDFFSHKPRFNVAPTQVHPILLAEREAFAVQPARWGLVNSWAKDAKRASRQINARSETVAESRAYARSFKRRRCLIPADGWYEWSGPKNQRQPHWIHRADHEPFVFAGLYDVWYPEPERAAVTFTILTQDSTEALASIHSRMPVVLPPDRLEAWLDSGHEDQESVLALLELPPDDAFIAESVSTRVNSVKNDDPGLLLPEQQPRLDLG